MSGWNGPNGRYYRDLAEEERRKERQCRYTARWRARQMLKGHGVPLGGEREYLAAFDRGATELELEAILDKWLAEQTA